MGIWGRGWYSMDRKLQLYSMRTFQRPELQIVFTVNNKVQFSCSVVSDSLWPRGLQHARLPCPSSTPRACSNSCLSSQWCRPTISSSVIPFSSCPQSFPESGSFPMSQFFTSGGQSIGVSASTSVLSMNTKDWSSLGWTGWISLWSKGLLRVFSNTTVQNHQFFSAQFSLATHSSAPAWKIPWAEEPSRLQSMRSLRVGHDWATSLFSLSCIGEGNGNPLQCPCLENPRDGGAWWASVYGVAQSQTWLTEQ